VGGKNGKKGDLVERKEASKGRVKEVGQDPPCGVVAGSRLQNFCHGGSVLHPALPEMVLAWCSWLSSGTGNTRWSSSFQCSG